MERRRQEWENHEDDCDCDICREFRLRSQDHEIDRMIDLKIEEQLCRD